MFAPFRRWRFLTPSFHLILILEGVCGLYFQSLTKSHTDFPHLNGFVQCVTICRCLNTLTCALLARGSALWLVAGEML
eukprot:s292_g8.t1